jgi:hypothetical protein
MPCDVRLEMCPFCQISPSQTQKGFASHVGRHHQEISLAALPRLEEGSDNGSENDDSDDDNDSEDGQMPENPFSIVDPVGLPTLKEAVTTIDTYRSYDDYVSQGHG